MQHDAPHPPSIYEERRERLRKAMRERDISTLLVSHAANRFYLSGFELHDPQCNETSGWLVITTSGNDWLLTDARYTEAAARLWPRERVHVYTAPRNADVGRFLKDNGFSEVAAEATTLAHTTWNDLAEHVTIADGSGLVEKLRIIKDEAEIGLLKTSCALNHWLMHWLPEVLTPGTTEAEVAWQVERFFRENGATEMAFDTIVGVNENGALPHAVPGGRRIAEECLVLVDTGCRLGDYCSDQTRVFWVGDAPTDRYKEVLELVQRAQQAALDVIRPGVPLRDAYMAAMRVFEDAGQHEHFTHGLGHGIGLETHEAPGVSSRSSATFQPGHVVTVEPGLYYPDWGGVRWEYMVVVTDDGVDIL